MMKIILVVMILLSHGPFVQCASITKTWHDAKMLEVVVPAYRAAYTTLKNNILDPFLVNVTADNETAINQLVTDLTCSVQRFYDALDLAVNSSQTLRIEADQKVVDAIAAVSAKEREISEKQRVIQEKSREIDGVRAQVATAEQGVRDKQQGLANAENALRIAQQKVEDARNCLGGKKRRKRFWGSVFRPINVIIDRVIEKPFCGVVNSGGIDSAKDARGNAEQQLRNAQQQLDNFRQVLASLQGQKSNLDSLLSQLQKQLQDLRSSLDNLREVRDSSATINEYLKKVTSHITKIWDASAVLYKTIQSLISFDSLIIPLNAVYTELTEENLLINMPVAMISSFTLAQVKHSLDIVASVLPQMPLNTLLSSITCDPKAKKN